MAMTWKRFWVPALAAGCALARLAAGDTRAGRLHDGEHLAALGARARLPPQTTLSSLQAYHDVEVESTFWPTTGSTCTEPPDSACTPHPGQHLFPGARFLGR